MSELRGLGVDLDTIRRWQDRGLIGPSEPPAQAIRPKPRGQPTLGERHFGPFPPLVEQRLPATAVEAAEEPSVD